MEIIKYANWSTSLLVGYLWIHPTNKAERKEKSPSEREKEMFMWRGLIEMTNWCRFSVLWLWCFIYIILWFRQNYQCELVMNYCHVAFNTRFYFFPMKYGNHSEITRIGLKISIRRHIFIHLKSQCKISLEQNCKSHHLNWIKMEEGKKNIWIMIKKLIKNAWKILCDYERERVKKI